VERLELSQMKQTHHHEWLKVDSILELIGFAVEDQGRH
jgi:hypothetical protein